jgi:hypothetical protein
MPNVLSAFRLLFSSITIIKYSGKEIKRVDNYYLLCSLVETKLAGDVAKKLIIKFDFYPNENY